MRLSHGFARDVLERVIGGPLPGVEEVAARAQWRWLDPGQVLIEAGAPSRWLIIVETGLLVESVQKAAQVITVGFLEKGQVGGNFSLMQPDPLERRPTEHSPGVDLLASTYRYSAPIASRAVLVDAEQVGRLAARDRSWADLRHRLSLGWTLELQRRERDRLLKTPAERYVDFVAERPDVAGALTQREIARFLGVSEVTMSRLKARVARAAT